MNNINLIPIFIVGLMGSVHCIGMCGGIVSAFSTMTSPRRPFPIPVLAQGSFAVKSSVADTAIHSLAYNAGRIASYAAAGAIAGSLAGSAYALVNISRVQTAGFLLANVMLIVLGLYLMGVWHGLARLEAAGQGLWKRFQPLTKKFLPIDSVPKMFLFGSVWGWVPCGMVYSVLTTAMLTGSAVSGASVMATFGLGTLPMLMAVSLLGMRIRSYLQKPAVRIINGLIILAFGMFGIMHALSGAHSGWLDLLCLPGSRGL